MHIRSRSTKPCTDLYSPSCMLFMCPLELCVSFLLLSCMYPGAGSAAIHSHWLLGQKGQGKSRPSRPGRLVLIQSQQSCGHHVSMSSWGTSTARNYSSILLGSTATGSSLQGCCSCHFSSGDGQGQEHRNVSFIPFPWHFPLELGKLHLLNWRQDVCF